AASAKSHPLAIREKAKCADVTPESNASGRSCAIAGVAINRTAHAPIHQPAEAVLSSATANTIASIGSRGKRYPGSLFCDQEKNTSANTSHSRRNRTRSSAYVFGRKNKPASGVHGNNPASR